MRKILFRAYHTAENKMYYPEEVNDYFRIFSDGSWDLAHESHTIDGETEYLVSYKEESEPKPFIDGKIMQYTGLNDYFGVKIYEGDIVEVEFNDKIDVLNSWKGVCEVAFVGTKWRLS